MVAVRAILSFLRGFLVNQAALAAENLALRQQLAVLRRSVKRPKLRLRDRVFWVWLFCLWKGWRSSLIIVQPDMGTSVCVTVFGHAEPKMLGDAR